MRIVIAFILAWLVTDHSIAKPMNVVLFYADDWRFDTLGVAGNPVVKTPVLDALSARGVRFTENRVTTSICGVSRASLLTGQWMSRHGNESFAMFRTPWKETFPGVLRERGYHLGHVGKWHCGKFPADEFDFARAYGGKHWIKDEEGNEIHVTAKNERDALEFLGTRPPDKPFCLTVAFFATHAEDAHPEQFLPQKESMTLYEAETIPVPPNMTEESFRRLPPFIANEKNEGRRRWHWRFDEPAKYQKMMKNYYRMASEVDAACGRILAAIDRQGIRGETLVIFTTDNGYFHGEHGLADKWYPFEESIRVPLVIDDPRMPETVRGKTDAAMTLNVDLAPTILGAADAPKPESMQGQDISRLYLSEERPDWREDYFYEHATIRNVDFIPSSQALVTEEWKYFYWPDFEKEQLFHLVSDPREEQDLAQVPKHQQKLREMRARFQELRDAAK